MEITITEKAEFVCNYFDWLIIPDATYILINGPTKRLGRNFYIKTLSDNIWLNGKDIEKMYSKIKQNKC